MELIGVHFCHTIGPGFKSHRLLFFILFSRFTFLLHFSNVTTSVLFENRDTIKLSIIALSYPYLSDKTPRLQTVIVSRLWISYHVWELIILLLPSIFRYARIEFMINFTQCIQCMLFNIMLRIFIWSLFVRRQGL